MRTDNGELRRLASGESLADGFERVPSQFERLASLKLRDAAFRGSESATVNTMSASPLAKWARSREKEKRKAKIAAASRRKNRQKK